MAFVACLVLTSASDLLWADQTAAPARPVHVTMSRGEMEQFLQHARVVRKQDTSKGVTGTRRVTLSNGTLTHDASVQTIDESRTVFQATNGRTEFNFRDTWRFNVAAYLLDKLLDIDMIPATVARPFDGKDASFTWWVDDVLMDEGARLKRNVAPPDSRLWNEQMWIVRVFDQLIYNTDRNLGNLLITKDWHIWMIDHTRAFRVQRELKSPGNLTNCDRELLGKLQTLNAGLLKKAMGDYLGPGEISGLLARRDAVVTLFRNAGDKVMYERHHN
jgi:hypothetical protein